MSCILDLAFGQLIHGRLGEIFGSKKWVILGVAGSLVVNFIVSFASSSTTMIVLWGINGLFQSTVWSQGPRLIANWWPKAKLGSAIGWPVACAGGASIVVWLTTTWALDFGGWRAAFRYPLILLFAALVFWWIFGKEKPQDVGLEPYKETDVDERLAQAEDREAELRRSLKPYFLVFRDPRFLFAAVIIGFVSWSRYILLTWVPSYYVQTFKVKPTAALIGTVGIPIGMAIGAYFSGYISDKLFKSKRFPAMMTMYAGLGIVALIIWILKPVPITTGLLLIMGGFFSFGCHAPVFALAADIGGRAYSATVAGSIDFVAYLFAAVQAALIGWLIQETGWWDIIFAAEVMCSLAVVIVGGIATKMVKA